MAQTAHRHQCAQPQPLASLHFCPLEAEAIGLNEAIVLARLRFWLGRSKHRFGGRPWIYNTYEAWQQQFPFWSHRTIQATFRRLERLGIVESTQAHNRSRWDKTKWYTINRTKLSELVPEPPAAPADADDAPPEPPSMASGGAADEPPAAAIDGAEPAPSWITRRSSKRSSERSPKSACVREPNKGARPHPLAAAPAQRPAVNELDAAYQQIPEGVRPKLEAAAHERLSAEGVPGFLRIVPTIRDVMVRLWLGELAAA